MSTFAVFGMTRPVAFAEAKKRVKGTRKNLRAPGGVEQIPLSEWLVMVEKKTEQIMGGYGSPAITAVRRATVRGAVHRAGSQNPSMPRYAHQIQGGIDRRQG